MNLQRCCRLKEWTKTCRVLRICMLCIFKIPFFISDSVMNLKHQILLWIWSIRIRFSLDMFHEKSQNHHNLFSVNFFPKIFKSCMQFSVISSKEETTSSTNGVFRIQIPIWNCCFIFKSDVRNELNMKHVFKNMLIKSDNLTLDCFKRYPCSIKDIFLQYFPEILKHLLQC